MGMTAKAKKGDNCILYIGSEENYFTNISYRFKTSYPHIDWDFQTIAVNSSSNGEMIFLKIIKIKPKIIYLDFCNYQKQIFILSELVSSDPLFSNVPIVGLTDKKEAIRECLGVGADFMYVKGGEFFDQVYAPMVMAFPKKVKPVKFAQAKLSREVELIDDFRVGYIAPTYMHVEGNLFLDEGKTVVFNSSVPIKNVPSKRYIVKNREQSNLYYDFNYSYDLDFVFVDEPVLGEEHQEDALGVTDEKERLAIIKNAKKNQQLTLQYYKSDYIQAQKKHKDWVVHNMQDFNLEKKTKVLVIDQSMRIFSLSHDMDYRKKYSFRCFTSFDKDFKNILKIRPSIIVVQFLSEISPQEDELFQKVLEKIKDPEIIHKFDEKEEEKRYSELVEKVPILQKEEMANTGNLITTIKAQQDYSPILVLFNSFWQSSKSLQQSFMYPMIVTYGDSLNMDVVVNLAEVYEKRQDEKLSELIKKKVLQLKKRDPRKYGRLNESDFKEKKYFIKKSNILSYGSIQNKILMIRLTESEIKFKSEIELPMKTYRLEYPMPMSINLVPIEEGKDFLDQKGGKIYRGIIHSISENDKKTLRQVVNDILFSPLNEKRAKEQEDFNGLNQKILDERRKAQEEAEQAANEHAEAVFEKEVSPEDEVSKESED